MKIQSIELENYRQYRGRVTVELSCDPGKNITVIQGVNGSGKTNMLNAVIWCLYGREERHSKYDTEKQLIFNEAELRNLPAGKEIITRVILKMIDENDNNCFYQFERSIEAKKDNSGRIIPREPEFHIYMQVGRDMNEVHHTELVINRILPHGVKSFFFFDGERLDEFFKEGSAEKVRDAIFDVSQLYVLKRTVEHLDKTISSMRNEIKDVSPRSKEIQDEIKGLERDLESRRQEREKNEEQLRQVRSKINEIDRRLADCSESTVKMLQRDRAHYASHLKDIEKRAKDNKESIIDKIIEVGPWIYCLQAVRDTIVQIEQRAEKGEIPPNIKHTFVKELLERGRCICGTDTNANDEARKRLEELLKKARISEDFEEIIELKYILNRMINEKVAKFLEEQHRLREDSRSLKEEKDETERRLDDISKRLIEIDVEEIRNLEISRDQCKREEEKLVREITISEMKIKDDEEKLERLNREFNKELERSKKFEEARERLDLATQTLHALETIRQKLIDEIRNTIQEKTQDHFLRLIWKKDTFNAVRINEEYVISVTNNFGTECLETLSAGERQILALSFLAALREVSGFDAPIIIDTPLGRISGEHKESIAKLLPEFLKDAQVTLFVTDEEYTPQVKQLLSQRVGREYRLCYDESRFQTKVERYDE